MWENEKIMTGYRICSLYSGSTGNAVLLETPRTKILIDAGKNARALTGALAAVGVDVGEIDAVLITHDHRDHVSALPVLLKHHALPVHVVEASAQVIAYGAGEEVLRCLCRHTPLFTVQVGEVTVRSFITPHDSAFSVGYRMTLPDAQGREHAIGYATDIGYVSEEVRAGLLGCESVVLECNHDREMLLTGPYPYRLKERILSRYGHLSNEDCAALSSELAARGARHLMLVHLSEQNNDPQMAYDEVCGAIGDASVEVAVAAPDVPVEMRIGIGEEARRVC